MGGERHILIVEDSEDLKDLLDELFKSEGFRTSCAINGQDGLNQLHSMKELPSVILLDIMMPVMDGVEFRKRQLEDRRIAHIPVVVMTADSNPQRKLNVMMASDFVKKPIMDVDALLSKIEKSMAS